MTHKTTMKLATVATVALAFASTAAVAGKLDGARYLKDAKVSLATARVTAMHTYPGKIVAEELEKESGGSGLRYSFDIKNGDAVHEVGIDARTGKVLENSVDSPADEAKEAAQETTMRKAHKMHEAKETNDGDED